MVIIFLWWQHSSCQKCFLDACHVIIYEYLWTKRWSHMQADMRWAFFFFAALSAQVLVPKGELITVPQCYESLVLYINNQNNPFPSFMKAETGSIMTRWINHIGSTRVVNRLQVQLKWTPDHCFQEDQGSDLWTAPWLESSIHTSPTVPEKSTSVKKILGYLQYLGTP